MNRLIFSTPGNSYPVSKIIYAGPVTEIAPDKRKSDSTHYFKMITSAGPVYCHFKSLDSAKKARNILGVMMGEVIPTLFKTYGGDLFDLSKVVLFSRIVQLKNNDDNCTHAFVITFETCSEKPGQVWMTYKSEDLARKARRALYAALHSIYNMHSDETEEEQEVSVVECTTEVV